MSTDPKSSVPTVALTPRTHAKLLATKSRLRASTNLGGLRITHDMLIAAGLEALDKVIDWTTFEDPKVGQARVVAAFATILLSVATGQGVQE